MNIKMPHHIPCGKYTHISPYATSFTYYGRGHPDDLDTSLANTLYKLKYLKKLTCRAMSNRYNGLGDKLPSVTSLLLECITDRHEWDYANDIASQTAFNYLPYAITNLELTGFFIVYLDYLPINIKTLILRELAHFPANYSIQLPNNITSDIRLYMLPHSMTSLACINDTHLRFADIISPELRILHHSDIHTHAPYYKWTPFNLHELYITARDNYLLPFNIADYPKLSIFMNYD